MSRPRPFIARMMYMSVLPLAEVRANLSKLVDSAVSTHERVEVTRNGRRAAVLLAADDYDALLETLDVLSSAEELAAVRDAAEQQADLTSESEMREILAAHRRNV